MNQIKLGKQIRKYRLLKKMTQNDLSYAADVSRNYISDLERGVKGCKVVTLTKIANALDVSTDILLKNDLNISKDLLRYDVCQDIMKLSEKEVHMIANLVEGMIAKAIIEDK